MPFDDHIAYDEFKRDRNDEWQPEALRLPLYVPRPEEEEAHTEEADEDSSNRGVLIIDIADGYSVVE